METGSPRKIQFTMPLLDTHLDPEAAEQIRRRRPTPATLVASSDQSSPEIDEDRIPNQLYKAALLNSPRQRRKGPKGNPTMKELQFLVEHHLYLQQQGGDECSSESCLSDRPSPDRPSPDRPSPDQSEGDELPHDDQATLEAFEKLRCQMEEFSRESLLDGEGPEGSVAVETGGSVGAETGGSVAVETGSSVGVETGSSVGAETERSQHTETKECSRSSSSDDTTKKRL